jgi:hypothetical protein
MKKDPKQPEPTPPQPEEAQQVNTVQPVMYHCPECPEERLIEVTPEAQDEPRTCTNGHTMNVGERYPKM